MDWLLTSFQFVIGFFQKNPVIPVFLTLGLGFWLGKLKIGTFSLGAVAATLIVGVIIGQMKIPIPDILKTVFFLLFLFSIGYSVGPQFFKAMKGSGLKMAGFAIIEALLCAGLVILTAHLMGYGNAVAAGLFAGSQTVSASLGLLGDTVREMPLSDSSRENMLLIIPACYAVTYVFGTVGSAWFLASIGPKMLGGLEKVKEDVSRIEQEMDSKDAQTAPSIMPASRPVMFRAYLVENDFFDSPRTVREIEQRFLGNGERIMVERAKVGGEIVAPSDDLVIRKGDHIVLGGRRDAMVNLTDAPGPEISDPELLNFGAERTPVTVASGKADGMTLGKLRQLPCMERVIVASLKRSGLSILVKNGIELHAGDVITLVGWPSDVAAAAAAIGYADRETDTTDMVFVGLGIAAGCVLGALSVRINGIPMALGTSVGALIAVLVLGWLRARKPSFGHIPSSVLWLFNNLGVNMFIAVLGITAGGALLHGLREAGFTIIIVGAVLTILSLAISILIARKLFHFSTPETLGCVAGGRCGVAAIGAIQQALQSDVPNLGYTVTYAVANIALVFSSLLVLFLT